LGVELEFGWGVRFRGKVRLTPVTDSRVEKSVISDIEMVSSSCKESSFFFVSINATSKKVIRMRIGSGLGLGLGLGLEVRG
jgi:hypothetical protein